MDKFDILKNEKKMLVIFKNNVLTLLLKLKANHWTKRT